jgi:hypothetical protein
MLGEVSATDHAAVLAAYTTTNELDSFMAV